ncbi:lecithin retinol acyltransferase family protein [Limnoraphis robusta Tam1]|uniref:Lecithin retinol acyltransferase family protein n=1 Tax=Limnoraphis robusta CCNP1315 TaxID=3110306 RepID=A0ABU5U2Y1_9CYAN|nr:lecithin retinol acyltransferase family protein [Limnoraphis robusta]MEA5498271.1 lecithin retinol acyltransferase family protein [Limnoraphis robusta BA-68 BA1]MEA5521370.1 lecithin retinol acyltransferase family protein [Limnoraphis robusta CCNP1315]MEA5540293.1 lecithin retinol acyltransferase family protein [Limnoraphis robusta Tam1]MEA5547953.1 lecithin retinol acyltransferase family protein [Limnoraphis robusta CCNP1324]
MTEDLHIFQPGDHICRNDGHYWHHGIYCGDITLQNRIYHNVVIHYTSKNNCGQIRSVSYENFANNQDIYYVDHKHDNCFAPETVIHRAVNRLGEIDYNIFRNNCEHFANWCKIGKKVSYQVSSFNEKITTPVTGAAAAVALGSVTTQVSAGGLLGLLGATTTVAMFPSAVVVGGAIAIGLGVGMFIDKVCNPDE